MEMKYPLGESEFARIREQGELYVDKTALVYDLVDQGHYYQFVRPSRFGKTLLISTIEAYLQGRKELFKGLAIEQLEKEWRQHPVLRMDFSHIHFGSRDDLNAAVDHIFSGWEQLYGITPEEASEYGGDHCIRFQRIIERAHEQTGEYVAVLVDEYEKPVRDAMLKKDRELVEEVIRDLMGIFTLLKAMGEHTCLIFMSGTTNILLANIFSGLNNLNNISMFDDFVALCGVTETELHRDLEPAVAQLAQAHGQTLEQCYEALSQHCGGYRLSDVRNEFIYNPYSLMQVLAHQEFQHYWYNKETMAYIRASMEASRYAPSNPEDICADHSQLMQPWEPLSNPIALCFQGGIFTLWESDGANSRMWSETMRLRLPNEEARYAFEQIKEGLPEPKKFTPR
jgi:hypothetical protein